MCVSYAFVTSCICDSIKEEHHSCIKSGLEQVLIDMTAQPFQLLPAVFCADTQVTAYTQSQAGDGPLALMSTAR